MRISVVIPAFNEEGNIGRLIEETFATVPEEMLGEVVVVDDASEDGTRGRDQGTVRQICASALSPAWGEGRPKCRAPDRRAGGALSGNRHHGRRRAKRSERHHAARRPARRRRPRACHGRRHQNRPQGHRLAQGGLALCQFHSRQGARRRLPRHGMRHQALPARRLSRAALFQRHAPLFACLVPDLRPRNRLCVGQRSAETEGRLEIY